MYHQCILPSADEIAAMPILCMYSRVSVDTLCSTWKILICNTDSGLYMESDGEPKVLLGGIYRVSCQYSHTTTTEGTFQYPVRAGTIIHR